MVSKPPAPLEGDLSWPLIRGIKLEEALASSLPRWTEIWNELGVTNALCSVNERTSAWFRSVESRHQGQTKAGSVAKDVSFVEEGDPAINEQIDAAYRAKYRRYAESIIDHINGSNARAATIKLLPRDE